MLARISHFVKHFFHKVWKINHQRSNEMQNSMELLEKALEKKTASEWARMFNIVPSTITNAKVRGRLGAALAGNFAMELGEPPERWIAIAALEAETKSPLTERLRALGDVWRNRRDSSKKRAGVIRFFNALNKLHLKALSHRCGIFA
jgi:hypothetical protein